MKPNSSASWPARNRTVHTKVSQKASPSLVKSCYRYVGKARFPVSEKTVYQELGMNLVPNRVESFHVILVLHAAKYRSVGHHLSRHARTGAVMFAGICRRYYGHWPDQQRWFFYFKNYVGNNISFRRHWLDSRQVQKMSQEAHKNKSLTSLLIRTAALEFHGETTPYTCANKPYSGE